MHILESATYMHGHECPESVHTSVHTHTSVCTQTDYLNIAKAGKRSRTWFGGDGGT